MTKITHPALLEMENEKLRGLLASVEEMNPPLPMGMIEDIREALSQLAEPVEPALAAVPDSGDAFYAGLYKKSAPMWHRLHDLAVSKGYDHVRFAIECAPVYKCDCMGARKVAIDMDGNTIPCECVAAANEAEPAPAQDERTGYACHQCRAETPAPEPYKLYVVCQACGASTAATAAQALTLPAQTEQQPVAIANRGEHAFWVRWTEAGRELRGPGIKLYAAPVAQPAQTELVEALPTGVYYSQLHDNFFDESGVDCGLDFHEKWHSRRKEFPSKGELLRAALAAQGGRDE